MGIKRGILYNFFETFFRNLALFHKVLLCILNQKPLSIIMKMEFCYFILLTSAAGVFCRIGSNATYMGPIELSAGFPQWRL